MDTTLPVGTVQLLGAFVQLSGAIMAVIALTGLGKWLAEHAGITIDGNQVRFVTAVVATVVAVGAGLLGGNIPGIGAFPSGGGVNDWLLWALAAATPLTLFANAVWRWVYKPQPESVLIEGETVVSVEPPLSPALSGR